MYVCMYVYIYIYIYIYKPILHTLTRCPLVFLESIGLSHSPVFLLFCFFCFLVAAVCI